MAYAGHAAQAFVVQAVSTLDILPSIAGQQKVILGLSQEQTGMFLKRKKKLD